MAKTESKPKVNAVQVKGTQLCNPSDEHLLALMKSNLVMFNYPDGSLRYDMLIGISARSIDAGNTYYVLKLAGGSHPLVTDEMLKNLTVTIID